jgi:hypothetical protein
MTTQTEKSTRTHLPEPWLRGTLADVPAAARAVLHAFELASEDVRRWCFPLSIGELNSRPFDLPSVASHLRHMVRSLDRLLTYAEGNQLSADQMAQLRIEREPVESREALFAEFENRIEEASRRVRALAGSSLEEARSVGRRGLPASLGGLIVHLADHTQRHVGQAITTAKVVMAQRDHGTAPQPPTHS